MFDSINSIQQLAQYIGWKTVKGGLRYAMQLYIRTKAPDRLIVDTYNKHITRISPEDMDSIERATNRILDQLGIG